MKVGEINHDMTPPEGGVHVGFHAGLPVYEITREVPGRQVEAKDPATGAVLYHEKDGRKIRPMLTREEGTTVTEEVLLVPLGNGSTQMVRGFRPSDEELEREKRRESATPDAVLERLEAMELALAAAAAREERLLRVSGIKPSDLDDLADEV